ncbi:unnamed protein product [Acanthoscelides obtectus]|uniref:Uncharacterized protein n=1 Tax=Acanthoscelides obtectus TaxID=200917 RepID=A0A9P0LHX2_ACAOB|nr:unnamed protein product [Acanthoscelides obtectus]CAK1620704.1 hypothetical protein AOBTE_LOCUS518 [Acanthoscelides obtectus]
MDQRATASSGDSPGKNTPSRQTTPPQFRTPEEEKAMQRPPPSCPPWTPKCRRTCRRCPGSRAAGVAVSPFRLKGRQGDRGGIPHSTRTYSRTTFY